MKRLHFLCILLIIIFISAVYTYIFFSDPIVLLKHAPQTARPQIPIFDPKLLSWSSATSSAEWQPRDSAASFVFQNKMWTMGGLNGNKKVSEHHVIRYWEASHFNDIWSSGDGVRWQREKEHAKWPPRRSLSIVTFSDKLWMFGGWSPVNGYTNDIWQSDDGMNWTKSISQAPWQPREGQTAEVFQGKIWLMGGVHYDKREVKNDIWYSDDGLAWHQATTTIPWSPRWDHATAVFNGKIFLTGGMNLSGETFKDIWSSSDGLHWELVTASPPWQERQGHSLVVFRDKLWILGRLNDSVNGSVNDIWYSDDGMAWQKTNTDPPWSGREDHSALVFNKQIYIFGGMSADWQWKNDIWFSK